MICFAAGILLAVISLVSAYAENQLLFLPAVSVLIIHAQSGRLDCCDLTAMAYWTLNMITCIRNQRAFALKKRG